MFVVDFAMHVYVEYGEEEVPITKHTRRWITETYSRLWNKRVGLKFVKN